MNWRLVLLLALLAMPGPVVMAWLVLPVLVDAGSLQVPLRTLQVATAVQGLVLVVLAAVVGTWLGSKAGLRAPVLSALAARVDMRPALRAQLLPGFFGGLLGAAVIVGFYTFAPSALAPLQGQRSVPLIARVLYGGVTEEILMRWGLMSLFVWAGWRVLQRNRAKASATVVWLAIGLSALLFGVSHVPSVVAVTGSLSFSVLAYITAGNALFGVVAGYLFWRFGLEAAILAHVLAHLMAYAVGG